MVAYWLARAHIADPVDYKKYTDRASQMATLRPFGVTQL